tara:strand:- start:53 stop:295 length:243 start_codon:yes stop_codon:yes gene_type:complete
MPKGQTPRQRKFRKETKPLRQATRLINDSLEKIKKTPGMVGMAGINKAVFNKAKKLKPSGRLNASDIKRARDMLKKRKTK